MRRENVKKALLFGAVALFLCGVGDWLLGYVPLGGEPILFGFLNSNIAQVPLWFYLASMALAARLMPRSWSIYLARLEQIVTLKCIERFVLDAPPHR